MCRCFLMRPQLWGDCKCKQYLSKTRGFLPLHLMLGHASLCTNGDIYSFSSFAPAALLRVGCRGWVGGGLPRSLLSTLFAHRHSDLCLSAHSSVKQDRGCLLERVHSTWESRMPPAEEPAVAPVHKEAEGKKKKESRRRHWQTKLLSAPVDLSLASS